MNRRAFFQGAGIVTVLVAGGGVWRAYDHGVFTTGQGPAYEPWKDWRNSANEGPLAFVRAAILAASPHNTQPWLFKVSHSSIELFIDTSRNVGALDPYLREEHIGMGCALENLVLAAAAGGFSSNVTLFPAALEPIPSDPKPKLVARVDLTPAKPESSELYEAIPNRHTNRGTYNIQKPVPAQFIDDLNHLVAAEPDAKLFIFTAEAERKKIVEISSAANAEIYSDPEVQKGSEKWVRLNWHSVQKYRDGLTIDAFGLPPIATAVAKIMPLWMLAWAGSRQEKDGYAKLMLSAPLIGILAVRDRYDQADCLRAGRLWQRTHLLATARGLAGRPCNESVEMIDHERAQGKPAHRAALLAEILGDPAWQPTFVFYMGYPVWPAHASPRRPVELVTL
jgi:nitroreductase